MDTYSNETTQQTVGAKVFENRSLRDGDQLVVNISTAAADLYNVIDGITANTKEAGRLLAVAKTQLETAAMFAVKAISRNY